MLRHLFETTVARCIAEGLVSGQRFAADASLIEADANKQNSTPKDDWDHSAIDPEDAPRAVREYLDVLNDAAFGAATTVEPKFTSHSDPSSQWTAARKGPAFFAYSTNYLIDTDHSVIVEGEALKQFRRNYSDPNRGPSGKGVAKYQALKHTCQACPSKMKCCPNADARKITREEHEDARRVDEVEEEGRNALRPSQTHPRLGTAPTTRPMRRK